MSNLILILKYEWKSRKALGTAGRERRDTISTSLQNEHNLNEPTVTFTSRNTSSSQSGSWHTHASVTLIIGIVLKNIWLMAADAADITAAYDRLHNK